VAFSPIGWVYGRRGGMHRRTLAWPVALLLVVAVHAASVFFILRMQVNNAPEVYYNDDSPAVLLRNALRRDFPNDEALTVVFQGTDLYGREFLTRLQTLSDTLQRNPLVDRVTSVLSLERISGSSDGFAVERLVDPARLKKLTPEALRQRVLGDRFAPGALASRDGTVLALAVRPKPLTESAERLALKIAVAVAINDAGLRPYYAGDAGPVTLDVAQLDSVLGDTKNFMPLTVAISLGLLAWVVGRLRPVVIGGLAMSTVVLPTIAAIGVAGQPYTMATAILPSLLAAYAVATLLHLYAGVQRAQAGSESRAQCVDRALGETVKPSFFNVLTTGAGLLSLTLVPIPPIQVFGVAGALGTVLVFLTVFVLVPPLLVRWDGKPWPQRGSGMSRFGRWASRLALVSMRFPRTVVFGGAAVMLAAFPLVQQVKVESDVLAFFKPAHPVSRDTRLVESKLSGVTTLEISLVGDGRDSLQNVATLGAVRDFQRWLEALPEVDRTVSVVDLVEEMHWAMNGEKPAFRTLPGTDRLLRQYLLVYDGQDLYELVNRDFEHARIVLNLNVHGAKEIGRSIAVIRAHLAAQPLPGVKVDIGGYGRLFADQVDLLVSGQIKSFAGAFALIFVFMAVLWRSPGAAALCMVPNIVPLYFVFVLMGGAGIHLDLATVMIAGVVLGITVDDTIHLYHGYRLRRRAGISTVLAVARSFESAGRAALATTLVLVSQFSLLATSDFLPTANFGLMTSVGLISGLMAEFLLPALLMLRLPRRRPAAVAVKATAGDPAWAPTALLRRPDETPAGTKEVTDEAWAPTRLLERPTEEAGLRAVLVCRGAACQAQGADALWLRLNEEKAQLQARGLGTRTQLVQTSCLGPCERAPAVQLLPSGRFCRGRGRAALVRDARGHMLETDSDSDIGAVVTDHH
jgi:predicted RND superfamily exporter protein